MQDNRLSNSDYYVVVPFELSRYSYNLTCKFNSMLLSHFAYFNDLEIDWLFELVTMRFLTLHVWFSCKSIFLLVHFQLKVIFSGGRLEGESNIYWDDFNLKWFLWAGFEGCREEVKWYVSHFIAWELSLWDAFWV